MPVKRLRGLRKYAKPWKKNFANNLRRHMTLPERLLWSRLRDKQIGVRVYAQSIVLGYILDFWIPSANLCLEVDGPCHNDRKVYDLKRDLVLKHRGIATKRFTADEVTSNLNAVASIVKILVAQRIA